MKIDIGKKTVNAETLYVCCKLWQLFDCFGEPPDPNWVEMWGITRQEVACMQAYLDFEHKRRQAKD